MKSTSHLSSGTIERDLAIESQFIQVFRLVGEVLLDILHQSS